MSQTRNDRVFSGDGREVKEKALRPTMRNENVVESHEKKREF